jgi:hypothetical protein
MGKPYVAELSRLEDTYSWALTAPIGPLVDAVSASSDLPLLAVGSGGSFSAAHLACFLHQYHTGMVSRPVTPLELVSSSIRVRSLSAMILSAGGSNADIISALENTISREPRRCVVFCLRKGSTLVQRAQSYRFVDVLDLSPPSIRDGFLATNSLLAFGVLLVRAYSSAFSSRESLPHDFDGLLSSDNLHPGWMEVLNAACAPLWRRESLVVLYGPSVSTAALDLESKFSEAALGNVQLADFRNFAHGRHHWLAKRESQTGVLALFAKNERDVAEKTLRLIPSTIPTARVCVPSVGTTASIAALVAVLHLVGAAGEHRGIDPGRPVVPTFGRRIYRLRALGALAKAASGEEIAIARKLGRDVRELPSHQDLAFWREAYRRFVEALGMATFGAVLLDYDGTLCDERDRFSGPREDDVRQLTRLLQEGMLLGIATGRGDSARNDLRNVLPRDVWDSVHIGYYNGSDLGCLSDDAHPGSSGTPSDSMTSFAADLSVHPVISRLATCKPGENQVSVRPASPVDGEMVWRVVQQLAQAQGLVALRSSHSIDVLRPGVSKCSLLSSVRNLLCGGADVLTIGDMGQWPGNDYEILGTPYSLSVDEVSADPDSCWNIAPAGHRGAQAVQDYLSWIRLGQCGFGLTPPGVGSRVL